MMCVCQAAKVDVVWQPMSERPPGWAKQEVTGGGVTWQDPTQERAAYDREDWRGLERETASVRVQASAAMDSCPVCYSTFSSEDADAVPRKLPCDHVACTQCLRDCFEEASEHRDPNEPVRASSFLLCPPRPAFWCSWAFSVAIALCRCVGLLCNGRCNCCCCAL